MKQPNLLRGSVSKCSQRNFTRLQSIKNSVALTMFLYYSVAHFHTISSSLIGSLQNLMQCSQNWSHTYVQDKASSHPIACMMHKLLLLLMWCHAMCPNSYTAFIYFSTGISTKFLILQTGHRPVLLLYDFGIHSIKNICCSHASSYTGLKMEYAPSPHIEDWWWIRHITNDNQQADPPGLHHQCHFPAWKNSSGAQVCDFCLTHIAIFHMGKR